MINTLTLEEAIQQAPAINADRPSAKASNKYTFISTRSILERALEKGWHIKEATQSRGGVTGQHKVTLIHNDYVSRDLDVQEGYPQINLINSHDLTKRLIYALGYFRQVCSNGLIAPVGMCSHIRTVHRLQEGKLGDLMSSLDLAHLGFNSIHESINNFKNRVLTQQEKIALANFAHYIRFRYRMQQPKKVNVEDILKPRRSEDEGDDLWRTFNTIQENVTRGGGSIGRGITQFQDDVRFNQELWSGANASLFYREDSLNNALKQLFPKKERKKSSSLDLILPS
jgi:hypothetical protein